MEKIDHLDVLKKDIVKNGGMATDIEFMDEAIAKLIGTKLAIKGLIARLGHPAFPSRETAFVNSDCNKTKWEKRRFYTQIVEFIEITAETVAEVLLRLKQLGYTLITYKKLERLGYQLTDECEEFFKTKRVVAFSRFNKDDRKAMEVYKWLNYASAYPSRHVYFSGVTHNKYEEFMKNEHDKSVPLLFAVVKRPVPKKKQ